MHNVYTLIFSLFNEVYALYLNVNHFDKLQILKQSKNYDL